MNAAYFVTGTDTEVGKTTIAAGLLHVARRAGLSTAGSLALMVATPLRCRSETSGRRSNCAKRARA